MHRGWLACLALACATVDGPPGDTDGLDTGAALPACEGFDVPCDVLRPRPTTWTCGPAFFEGESVVFPATLSATGCVTSVDPLVLSDDTVRYEVRAPLWSDGAEKGRWWALPPDASVRVTSSGPWVFPEGAVLLKSFGLRRMDDDPSTTRWLELRVMVRRGEAWHFATYVFDADGSEARLLGDRGRFETVTVTTNEGPIDIDWWYPGVDGCQTCHRSLADEALGPRTVQMNMPVVYDGVRANQLVALASAGWLGDVPTSLDGLAKMRDPYAPQASAEERARAWLHGQCAHCHTPGGFAPPEFAMDLRHGTPLADMAACGVPRQGAVGAPGTPIIAPGDADNSMLIQRMRIEGVDRMPAGTSRLDEAGIAAVAAWIDGLSDCP